MIFSCTALLFPLVVLAQEPMQNDTLVGNYEHQKDTALFIITGDTISSALLPNDSFKPDPMKVVWTAAVIPGFGQVLNRQYWKLPIVYGGFLVCGYALSWNSKYYQSYKTAYRDIIDNDPTTNSFLDILPPGYTVEGQMGGYANYTNVLNTRQNTFRRYRDLSIFACVAYYGLTIIEAFVSAHLYDFDISPDLSMSVTPALMSSTNFGIFPNAVGMNVSISLR